MLHQSNAFVRHWILRLFPLPLYHIFLPFISFLSSSLSSDSFCSQHEFKAASEKGAVWPEEKYLSVAVFVCFTQQTACVSRISHVYCWRRVWRIHIHFFFLFQPRASVFAFVLRSLCLHCFKVVELWQCAVDVKGIGGRKFQVFYISLPFSPLSGLCSSSVDAPSFKKKNAV